MTEEEKVTNDEWKAFYDKAKELGLVDKIYFIDVSKDSILSEIKMVIKETNNELFIVIKIGEIEIKLRTDQYNELIQNLNSALMLITMDMLKIIEDANPDSEDKINKRNADKALN